MRTRDALIEIAVEHLKNKPKNCGEDTYKFHCVVADKLIKQLLAEIYDMDAALMGWEYGSV